LKLQALIYRKIGEKITHVAIRTIFVYPEMLNRKPIFGLLYLQKYPERRLETSSIFFSEGDAPKKLPLTPVRF